MTFCSHSPLGHRPKCGPRGPRFGALRQRAWVRRPHLQAQERVQLQAKGPNRGRSSDPPGRPHATVRPWSGIPSRPAAPQRAPLRSGARPQRALALLPLLPSQERARLRAKGPNRGRLGDPPGRPHTTVRPWSLIPSRPAAHQRAPLRAAMPSRPTSKCETTGCAKRSIPSQFSQMGSPLRVWREPMGRSTEKQSSRQLRSTFCCARSPETTFLASCGETAAST